MCSSTCSLRWIWLESAYLKRGRSLSLLWLSVAFLLVPTVSSWSHAKTRRQLLKQTTWSVAVAGTAPAEALIEPQFHTVSDIPLDYFTDQRTLFATVERVLDGDTIRVRHYPGNTILSLSPSTSKPFPANETLKIRLYGVDTPETAKTKEQTPQPFALEAKDFVQTRLLSKKKTAILLTLADRDQYGRAIARVQILEDGTDISLALLRAGLAEVYRGRGASYLGQKPVFEDCERQARQEGIGIWSLGEARVSAAEEKRQRKAAVSANQ